MSNDCINKTKDCRPARGERFSCQPCRDKIRALTVIEIKSEHQRTELLNEAEILIRKAKDAARKLDVSYHRGEISPRSEFDDLISVRERLTAWLYKNRGMTYEMQNDDTNRRVCTNSSEQMIQSEIRLLKNTVAEEWRKRANTAIRAGGILSADEELDMLFDILAPYLRTPTPVPSEQCVLALIAHRKAQPVTACACLGCENGEPLCICSMRAAREDTKAVLDAAGVAYVD